VSMKWMAVPVSILVGLAAWADSPKPTPPKPTPALLERGKTLYASNCLGCHGAKGDGKGPAGAYLLPKPRNFTAEPFKKGNKPEEVFQTLSTGIPASTMVSFGKLPEQERWALVYYVLDFQKAAKGAQKKGK
jgi:high-affinity iron transporter